VTGERELMRLDTRYIGENLGLLLKIAEIEVRKTVLIVGIFDSLLEDGEKPIGVDIWERFEKDSVDDAENCRVGADAERECEDSDRGEAGIFAQHTEREAEVLKSGFNERKAAEFAICFLELGIASETDARGADCVFGAHPASDVFLRRHFEMSVEFALKFAVDLFDRSLRAEAGHEGLQKGMHGLSPFRRCEALGR